MATPDALSLRAVMGRFAAGVTVMTTFAEGEPHGMTANAVSSVSLEPPLVLVCVERSAAMHELVTTSEVFALSFLAADQRATSEHFASPDRPNGHAMFDGLEVLTAASGSPILADALAYVDCRVWAVYDGGDHSIVVGEVIGSAVSDGHEALVYFLGDYAAVDGTP